MLVIPDYVVDTRDYARRVLREISHEGKIEGGRGELLAASALIQFEFAKHAEKFWSRGCNCDFDFLSELAAISICESRSPCSFESLRAMLQGLSDALQDDDIDEDEPTAQERYRQTHAFCLILAAVVEIKTQLAREDNEALIFPSQSFGESR